MASFGGRCPICLGEFIPEQISALRCGHTFHYECILQWLQTSKTCPECRSSANERNLIRQLFFNSGDISQLCDSNVPNDEECLKQKLTDIKQALICEQKAHLRTAEELQVLKKQKEKAEALSSQEKRKVKNLTSQLARLQQMELMLQDQQDLQKKLERYKARLKATEFYSLLVGTSGTADESKIDKYLDKNGDPDVQKFLDLMQRQYEETRKKLFEMKERLETSQKANLELRIKLDKHKKLNVALKEELANLHSTGSQILLNPRLKEVLAYSPGDPRSSLGFELIEDEVFSPSVMKSALKARSRPALCPLVKQTEERSLSPLLFDEDFAGPSNASLSVSNTEQVGNECEAASSSGWDVKIAKPIADPVKRFSKKKGSGLGGSLKIPLRTTDNINLKRSFPAPSSRGIKKHKSTGNVVPRPLSHFFSKNLSKVSEARENLNESVILLD